MDLRRLCLFHLSKRAIVVMNGSNRPQPRLDREINRGYAISVNRNREDPSGIFDIQFVTLSHNTIIETEGGFVLNAEAAILERLSLILEHHTFDRLRLAPNGTVTCTAQDYSLSTH